MATLVAAPTMHAVGMGQKMPSEAHGLWAIQIEIDEAAPSLTEDCADVGALGEVLR